MRVDSAKGQPILQPPNDPPSEKFQNRSIFYISPKNKQCFSSLRKKWKKDGGGRGSRGAGEVAFFPRFFGSPLPLINRRVIKPHTGGLIIADFQVLSPQDGQCHGYAVRGAQKGKQGVIFIGEMFGNILQYIEFLKESATDIIDELAELQAYIEMMKTATEKTGQIMVPMLSDELLKKYAKTAQKLVANPEK